MQLHRSDHRRDRLRTLGVVLPALLIAAFGALAYWSARRTGDEVLLVIIAVGTLLTLALVLFVNLLIARGASAQAAAAAELRERLEELRSSEQRFRLLVESVQDYAIFMLDPGGHIVSWNPGAERFKGYTEKEIVGRHFSTFYTEEDRTSGHPQEELRIASREGRYHEEGWRIRKDGSRFWADVTLTAVRDADSQLIGFAKITRDLTERRGAEESLRESETRFRALAENAAEAIVTIDAEDRILFANPAAGRIFGYDSEGLLKLRFSELIPEEYRARHREGMQHYMRTGERRIDWGGVELPGLTSSGTIVPLEVTFSEYTRNGKFFFTGIMRDVTERKRNEEERAQLLERERDARGEAERRAEQETALRQAIEAVSAVFTVEDTTHAIAERALIATRADGAFVERVDLKNGTVVVVALAGEDVPAMGSCVAYQGSFTEYVLEREAPFVLPRVGDAERGLPDAVKELFADRTAAVIPLLDAGEPIGSLILLRRRPQKDVFREDEVQRAFSFGNLASLAFRKIHMLEDSERRREELQRVTESRNRLMRGFSHDVKNPLGAADGYLQLLEMEVRGPLAPEQKQDIQRARRSLDNAGKLIEDLLDLARAEAGELEIELAPTDVREASREMAEEYRAQAEAAGLTLDFDAPDRMPIIQSDPTRVRQVVSNLLSNAVKYNSPQGRIRVHVSPHQERRNSHDRWVAVQVADTGRGISQEQQTLLFQEFTRLDPTAGKGAGIGLAISQRIANALGGDISVESEVGSGATFTLWLPLREVGERRSVHRDDDAGDASPDGSAA